MSCACEACVIRPSLVSWGPCPKQMQAMTQHHSLHKSSHCAQNTHTLRVLNVHLYTTSHNTSWQHNLNPYQLWLPSCWHRAVHRYRHYTP